METGFNSLACCDASRLWSEDFISEITPNLLPQWQALQKYWRRGRYHSLFLFTAANVKDAATMCPVCQPVDFRTILLFIYLTFGLSYFLLSLGK